MAPQEVPPVDPVEDDSVEEDPMEDDPVEDDPVEDDPIEDDPDEDDPSEDDPTAVDREGSGIKIFYALRHWPKGYGRSSRDNWAEDAQSQFEK